MLVAKKAFYLYQIKADYTNDKPKHAKGVIQTLFTNWPKIAVKVIYLHCIDTQTIQSYHESDIYPSSFTNVCF